MRNPFLNISIVLFLLATSLKGQFYDTGQDPASLRWETIKTGHFRFIFPETYHNEAIRASIVYEDAYRILSGTMDERRVKRFPIIIHNHSVESNGYVAWAPRRMELFPLPPQENLPMDHHQQLALHELTHVIQMQSLRHGISRPLSYLLGEQYTGALGIFTPFWFLEGQAVVSESIYSQSGRGRVPVFEKKLKALLLDGDKIYSYDKMINGSYRDYTPDHYLFGYQMSAWALAAYGSEVWSDAMRFTADWPFTANPFNFSLRKNDGLTKKKLYKETMNQLASTWKEEEKGLSFTVYDTINPARKGEYVNYYSPVRLDNENIAAIRTSLSKIPEIVSINTATGRENVLHTPGYMWPANLSSSSGLITWAENRYDPRWYNRGYSVVRILDTRTGLVRRIPGPTRYFSPALSHGGSMIAVAESTPEYVNSLLVLDVSTGEVIKRITIPGNVLPVMPAWSTDDSHIYFISYSDGGEGIMSYSSPDSTLTTILPPGTDDLESIAICGDTILFTSSVSGIDNIYALIPSGDIYRVSSSRFGASNISVSGDNIYFADYSASGNNVGVLPVRSSMKPFSSYERRSPTPIKEIDSDIRISKHPRGEMPEVKPYRKWMHLFNFHSWMPFWADVNDISVDNLAVNPGLTIMSQNHLSTMTTTLGYEYTGVDHLIHSTLTWKGWYPAFELDMTWGGTPVIIQDSDIDTEPTNVQPGLYTSAAVYIPLHFNSGKFSQTLWPYFRLGYNNYYVYDEDNSVYDYGQFLATTRFYFSNLHRMSARDIWPRWGQVIDINNIFSPSDSDLYGPVTSLRTTFYIPGFSRNHSIRLTAQAEKKEFRDLLLNNRITLPRGYMNVIPEKASVLTADYALPVAYPDFNIGGLIYLQRIRASLFYDWAKTSENYYYIEREMVHGTEILNSMGTEILADFFLLRIPFRLSTGIQAAWLPARNEPYYNILFNIDIFGFVLGKRDRFY